jgi:hypothetical protein
MADNSLFSYYIIDSNSLKNILLACDRFRRFIRIVLKYAPKGILLAKQGLGKAAAGSKYQQPVSELHSDRSLTRAAL